MTPARRFLLVETEAHVPQGHSAPYLRALALGFRAAGVEPTVLTSQGWFSGAADPSVPQRTYGSMSGWIDRRARSWRESGSALGRLAGPVQQLAALTAVRREARGGDYDGVILLASCIAPEVLLASAPQRGARWALSVRREPRDAAARSAVSRALDGLIERAGARAQVRRRRVGADVALVPVTPELTEKWVSRCDPRQVVRTVTAAISDAMPQQERRLGQQPVALFFGFVHPSKDPRTVWRAFAEPLDDVVLCSAGVGVAASAAEQWPQGAPAHVSLEDGYVEPDRMAELFASADVAVLSFPPGQELDSGVLGNALGFGVPVVCSAPSSAATLVESLGIGETFTSGDATDLRRAVRRVLAEPPLDAIERARRTAGERSTASAVARLWMSVFPGRADDS